MSTYIFDNAGEQAGQRFSSLETLYDPWTIRTSKQLASAQAGTAGKSGAGRLRRGLLYVVAGAPPLLEAAGVASRCKVRGGDAFTAVPAGYETYLLSRVIHDWDDERSIALLTRSKQAMQPRGKVLLVPSARYVLLLLSLYFNSLCNP